MLQRRIETFDRRNLADLLPIVEAENGRLTALKASIRSDGRVERRRGDEFTASLLTSEGFDGSAYPPLDRDLLVRQDRWPYYDRAIA
jgi:hypothetical protein